MDIFVFGSNLAGRHGKGAALHARQHWGAQYGVGRGLTGRAYAFPTKDERLRPLPVEQLAREARLLDECAHLHQQHRFLLTPVGCGLAGNAPGVMAGIINLYVVQPNIVLTNSWREHLSEKEIQKTGMPILQKIEV